MTKREKMLMVTFFYDPAIVDLGALTSSTEPIPEETLFSRMETCLEKGGLVNVSHVKADLVRIAGNCPVRVGSPPAYKWAALRFIPVQSAMRNPMPLEGAINA
ncbi:MAG: hypothetical protein GY942_20750 [Aestuariibacter sp.]|nr:hypothetical protein [Aestuariibacter sp.]